MSLFEEMLKLEHYQKLIKDLPEDDREALLKALKEFVDSFENTIIKPLDEHKFK